MIGTLGALGIASAIGALGSGIANAVSGYASQNSANATNIALMREQNQFNAEQAEIQRQWEEQMSNTSYQRAMADMEQAGLNPILAAGNLGGASTPSGSAASGTAAHLDAAKFDMSGIASALQSMSNIAIINFAKDRLYDKYHR